MRKFSLVFAAAAVVVALAVVAAHAEAINSTIFTEFLLNLNA